jgi:hypothetical protein
MTEVTIKITKAAHWELLKKFLETFKIGFELNGIQKEPLQNGLSADGVSTEALNLIDNLNNDMSSTDLFAEVIKPIRETISLEDLVREQNYTAFDLEGFNTLISKLNIQDPIEELLAYD